MQSGIEFGVLSTQRTRTHDGGTHLTPNQRGRSSAKLAR